VTQVFVATDRARRRFAYADPLPTDLPIATIRASDGSAHWFLDEAAAAAIPDAPSSSSSSGGDAAAG